MISDLLCYLCKVYKYAIVNKCTRQALTKNVMVIA
jgi:hypothetical protein